MEFEEDFLKSIKSEGFIRPGVVVVDFPGKGKGLVTKEKIRKDDIVSISGGIIIQKKDFEKFKEQYGDYAYFIEENFLIAPINYRNPSPDWRMNHCCEPNCGIRGQTVFVALRDIEPEEELTFDYAMSESAESYEVKLQCDKSSCRGKFCGSDWKNPILREKYNGYFSLYIQRKINSETGK